MGIALVAGITHSETALLALIAFLPVAWLFVLLLAVVNPGKRVSVLSLLKTFKHQVDVAGQQYRDDTKSIDQHVLREFDTLHTGIKALLARKLVRKKARFNHLRQEILRFPYPATQQQGPRWRPPTLSELGYVVGISEKFFPDSPLLALYKFSGEGRNSDGTLADTFSIMAASVPAAHAALFAAKIYSPITNTAAANSQSIGLLGPPTLPPRPEFTQSAATDEDNGMGYALSLLGPITLLSARELARNLQAIAQQPADKAAQAVMPAAVLRRLQRDLLTEKLEHAQAPLQMARHALLQAPQLLIAAMADASRDLKDSTTEVLPALGALAEILAPAAPAARPALVSFMSELFASVQALRVIPAGQAIVNPGITLIEGRGAETDAGFLKLVAQWVLPKPATGHLILITNLTGSTPPVQHVLWTLSGRALDAAGIDFKTLHVDRWRALTAPTPPGVTAGVTAG